MSHQHHYGNVSLVFGQYFINTNLLLPPEASDWAQHMIQIVLQGTIYSNTVATFHSVFTLICAPLKFCPSLPQMAEQ